ncbi:MAG TPA: hypothetical protein ENK32_01810 [Anaerolineae bacterium]|nr:hypothetical protein [Anaerolineae bacterium]
MEEFWQQIKETISDFLTRELIPEAIALLAIVLLGLLAGWILRRLLKRGERRLQEGPARSRCSSAGMPGSLLSLRSTTTLAVIFSQEKES